MLRKIIEIDEERCDGCGICVPNCHEGALQIIDGKARLISELFCDGLGACIGHCPHGAITVTEKEADKYSETEVMRIMISKPRAVLAAHLNHLQEHKALEYLTIALDFLESNGIDGSSLLKNSEKENPACGCASTHAKELRKTYNLELIKNTTADDRHESWLEQWPVQLHLVNPSAPYFKGKELVILSTCSPVASANIHEDYIRGRSVVVACPKLDYTDPYAEKLAEIFEYSMTPKVIIVIMEVPCCRGLSAIVERATAISGRLDMVVEEHTLSLEGNLLNTRMF